MVLSTLLVERLWDGLWLAVGIGLVSLWLPLPWELGRARDILAAVVLIGVALVLTLVLRRRRAKPITVARSEHAKLLQRARSALERLVEGVRLSADATVFWAVLLLALLKLVVQGLSYLMLMWAYGLEESVWVGLAVFLIAYLGVCVPSTPASAGVFQVFSIAGLRVFGIPKNDASGFALVAFIAWTVPLALAGFFALAQSGLTLRQIRFEMRTPLTNPTAR
jgi:uncharacterized protein (TIRG00374 family)